jgi:NADH dehydrogenase
LGDQAHFDENGKTLPGLAPVAIQQGKHAAKNIIRKLHNQPTETFKYLDKGITATIGRKKAVLQVDNIQFGGFFAWMAWLFIHIYYLIGFKNRFIVFFQWAWSYITLKRGARLIVNKEWRSTK